jgi:hypothetical protein
MEGYVIDPSAAGGRRLEDRLRCHARPQPIFDKIAMPPAARAVARARAQWPLTLTGANS